MRKTINSVSDIPKIYWIMLPFLLEAVDKPGMGIPIIGKYLFRRRERKYKKTFKKFIKAAEAGVGMDAIMKQIKGGEELFDAWDKEIHDYFE